MSAINLSASRLRLEMQSSNDRHNKVTGHFVQLDMLPYESLKNES